jgi:3-oxoadipate CoA-transferase alpha subunit
MAMAAKRTVATVHQVVALGEIDPEHIITPGIHVSKVVKIIYSPTQSGGVVTGSFPNDLLPQVNAVNGRSVTDPGEAA